MNAACYAYLGDAVFELCVREMLISDEKISVRDINRRARKYVSARGQAAIYHIIWDRLTEEEQSVMRRGRNKNNGSRAKNADMSDYRHATGLETLFGYLYHTGKRERIKEIFDLCVVELNLFS